jgi:hypothetical protein
MVPSGSWSAELGRRLKFKGELLERLRQHWLEAQMVLAAGHAPERAAVALTEAHAVIEQVRALDREIQHLEEQAPAQQVAPPEETCQIDELRASVRRHLGELQRLHGALDRKAIERLSALGKELASLREGRGAIENYRPFRHEERRFDRNA